MRYATLDGSFDYQAKEIFKDMLNDYKEEQKEREDIGDEIKPFAQWLWDNRDILGENFYNKYDEWTGIDEATEEFNYTKQ